MELTKDQRKQIAIQEYLSSTKGSRRIKETAKEYNRNHRISMHQCLEFARSDIRKWAEIFVMVPTHL